MTRIFAAITIMILAVGTGFGQGYSTYTGISGFYDYQTNYRTPQYIRACPGTSSIHAIMMVADDSLNVSTSRRTAYAYSSDGGATWTTFNNIRVPARRSGFPSLDILQGTAANAAVIANHNVVATSLQSVVYVDYPVGTGAFSELNAPPLIGGDEPIFPEVAGAADGSIVMLASRAAATTSHRTRITDFTNWQPWGSLTPDFVSDGYVVEANGTGRVGIAVAAPSSPLQWLESTDNGVTWPASLTELLPEVIPAGSDSFVITPSFDLVFINGDTLITFGVTKQLNGVPTHRFSGIGFYSGRTGFVLAVPHQSVPGAVDTLLKPQTNMFPVGYPAIGISGSSIWIAFQAFMAETSQAGFNYADIFIVASSNGGSSWTAPTPSNITNTLTLDERYVSMSKWNPLGQANLVFQEDSEPGAGAFGNDQAPVSRNRQRFVRIGPFASVGEYGGIPAEFALYQNYPNPFNPSTRIEFRVASFGFVSLKVFDLLGREVAMVVDEVMQPGSYERVFRAEGLASGVYLYQLRAGVFAQTKKLLLLR